MRLKLLMRDTEYRDAIIEMISELDKDIFVDMTGGASVGRQTVLLTDISPEEINSDSLMRLADRTVFLTDRRPGKDDADDDIHRVFKYSNVDKIMAEVSDIYHNITGDNGYAGFMSSIISICAEYDTCGHDRAAAAARQIIYRRGGSALVLPLGYINDHAIPRDDGRAIFQRLMYQIVAGRDYHADSYTCKDSYGISYLRIDKGYNPVADLNADLLTRLIRSLSSRFGNIILDAGTCYRRENIAVMSQADHIVYFGSGRRIADIAEILGESCREKIRCIDPMGATDEALALDDCVREIFGSESDSNEHQRSN